MDRLIKLSAVKLGETFFIVLGYRKERVCEFWQECKWFSHQYKLLERKFRFPVTFFFIQDLVNAGGYEKT